MRLQKSGKLVAFLDEASVLGLEGIGIAAAVQGGKVADVLCTAVLADGFVKFGARFHAQIVGEQADQLFQPFGPQGREDAAFQFLLLVFADDLRQALHGLLDRGNNVAGQQFRQVVQQTAEKIVDGSRATGPDGLAEKIGIGRHDEHVPQHGGGRDARGLRPANLEAELPAEIGETGQCRIALDDVRHAAHIGESRKAFPEGLVNFFHFLVKTVQGFDEAEFPLRSIEMGRREDTPGQAVRVVGMPDLHTLPKIAQRREGWFETFQNMDGKLAEVFLVLLDAIEDRRLDVRDDKAIIIVEKPALDDLLCKSKPFLVGKVAAVFVPEGASHQHLVRLFVDFHQLGRPKLVVPAEQVGPGKGELQQTFADGRHEGSLRHGRRHGIAAHGSGEKSAGIIEKNRLMLKRARKGAVSVSVAGGGLTFCA